MAADQAVLIIHGIGEQRPMQTLRGFVSAVWSSDTQLHKPHSQGAGLWSKPYTLSQDFELRRLTTAENSAGLRTDFFEFYWAHLMQGTKLTHLWAWLKSLLLRSPLSVPKHMLLLYAVLWCAVLLGIGASGYFAWQTASGVSAAWWAKWIVGLIVVPLVLMVLNDVVGDAARYLHVAPVNIQSRHAIRAAGLKVLESLHQRGYQRIVIVGHSLGSVIALDIIKHAWAATSSSMPLATGEVLNAVRDLEDLASAKSANTDHWHKAQRRLFDLYRQAGATWRVSDLITLGSPLAHASVLLARNQGDLARQFEERELPSCPPTLEQTMVAGKEWSGFSYKAAEPERRLHHAAPFAMTRWTNLYFPSRLLLIGDLVGGPLAPWFGSGVSDVAVATSRWWGLLSHTAYWQPDKANRHIAELRQALDLLDQSSRKVV